MRSVREYFVCALCGAEKDVGYLVKLHGKEQIVCKKCWEGVRGYYNAQSKELIIPGL